jgi:2-phospho-L-lactate guanylyltransferase
VRTLAVLPVKRFETAKARLAAGLGAAARVALAEAMFADVLVAIRGASKADGALVVTADERAAVAAREHGADTLRDPVEAGQSAAAVAGIERALAQRYDRVILLPGDTPLVEAAELDQLLAGSARERLVVAIVPDRHGTGTNALVLHPPTAIEPSFGPDSLARHRGAAAAAGLSSAVVPVPGLEHDVDTPDDLAALAARLEGAPSRVATRTRAALARLGVEAAVAGPVAPEPAAGE